MSGVDVLTVAVPGHPGLRATVRLGRFTVDSERWVHACASATEPLSGERMSVDGLDLAVKRGPVRPSGGRRHRMRRWLTGRPAPCEAEFENLLWLQKRQFQTPDPVVAVTIARRARPVQQLLATRWAVGSTPFEPTFREAHQAERERLANELGRELGRMHAVRFVHGDVYPRNVLVQGADGRSEARRRLLFIDAWAGGPHGPPRGTARRPTHDLGAWFSRAADWMDDSSQRAMLGAYVEARVANGRPIGQPLAWIAEVTRARRDELIRLERARPRLRGRPFPLAGWIPPTL